MTTPRFILILSLLILVNCTEKGKPVRPHSADTRVSEMPVATKTDPNADPAVATRLASLNLEQLAARVLDPARVRDPRSLVSREVRDELIALNERLLRKTDRAFAMPILMKYAIALETECGDIKASCLGPRYFKLSAASTEVAKMMAQMPEFAARAERLVLLAVEMKNELADSTLLRLVIEKVAGKTERTRHYIETAITNANEKIRDGAAARDFMNAIGATQLIAGKKWMLGAAAQSALWSMAARAKWMNLPEVRAAILRSQDGPGTFMTLQKSLVRPDALGASPVRQFDELYFLADSVFDQKMNYQVAAEIFAHSGRTPSDLAAAVQNYARLRFIITLNDSNSVAKGVFNAPITSGDILLHAIRQSSLVAQVWGSLANRLTLLQSFGSAALKGVPGGEKFEADLRSYFASYGRTVNLTVTHPHMMILFQKLSTYRFTIYLRSLGTVDTGELIPMLFSGRVPPLLNYAADSGAANQFEMLHAFDMAVRGRLFEAMGVDPDEFMSDILSRLNQKPTLMIEPTLNRLEQRANETPLFRDFEDICREIKGAPAVTRTIDLKGIRRAPVFGNVMEFLYTGMSSRGGVAGTGGGIDKQETGLFYADNEYAESIERVRLDVQQHERIAHAMLTSYTTYLKKFENKNDEEILKLTAKTRAQVESMVKLRERAVRVNAEWFERVGWCYFQAGLKDYRSYHQVLKLEEEYLRGVFRDMQLLRRGGLTAEQEREITERRQFRGLPSDFKGFDHLDKNGYTVSSIDLLIRTAGHLRKIAPNLRVNFGSALNMDVELVRNATIRQLPYTDNEQEFIDSAMKAYFAKLDPFVLWMSLAGERISMWQHYLKVMMTSYRMETESGGTAKVFTPARIMQAHEELLRITQLTADDRRLMALMHEEKRFDPLYFDERITRYTPNPASGRFELQDVWNLFDLPLRLNGLEKLGFDYDHDHNGGERVAAAFRPKRMGHLEAGRMYFEVRSTRIRGNPMIPYNPELDRELDARVGRAVRDGIRAGLAFQESARKYLDDAAARPATERPRADLTSRMSITNLYSDSIMPSYESTIRLFRQATQDCFQQRCDEFR